MIVRLVFHPCTKIQQKFERYHICRLHWLVLSNHRYSRTAHYPSGLFSLVRVSRRIIGKFSSTFSHTFHNSFTLLVHYWKKVFFFTSKFKKCFYICLLFWEHTRYLYFQSHLLKNFFCLLRCFNSTNTTWI